MIFFAQNLSLICHRYCFKSKLNYDVNIAWQIKFINPTLCFFYDSAVFGVLDGIAEL